MKASKRIVFILITAMLALAIAIAVAGCFPFGTEAQEGEAPPAEGAAGLFANYGTWIWLIILAAAFYFLLIRPQRTRSKKQQDLMSDLRRGDEIITVGGFYGRIKDVVEDYIIITIASGVDVKITKSAISKKMGISQ